MKKVGLLKTYQSTRERHKQIFDTWASGKSFQETAGLFGISDSWVHSIVEKYPQRLVDEENMRSSNDPLVQALAAGKISLRLYKSLVRGGYGTSFGFDELIRQLRTNSLNPMTYRNFGEKSLNLLRDIFLSRTEINAINRKG